MTSNNGNCCLKLNSLICGSKDFSSKTRKLKFGQKSFVDSVHSNNKDGNKKWFSSLPFHKEHHINVPSIHNTLQQEKTNSLEEPLKYSNDSRKIINSDYTSSLNCSNDQSYSTLNNQIIIKDIILHRNNPHERLGLTLSYHIKSRSTTNIYIEDVDQYSIAHCQGKLQRGDQIIQINNCPVKTRDQAINLINGMSTIILEIGRFKFNKRHFSTIESKDDSGVILAYNTDLETNDQSTHQISLNQYYWNKKYSSSLSCLFDNNCSTYRQNGLDISQIEYRRCLSLNDLIDHLFVNEENVNSSKCSIKDLIHSQTLFQITTDNQKSILKPLPFNNSQNENHFQFLQYQLKEEYSYRSKQIRRRYREERLKEQTKLLITTDEEMQSEFKQGRYWTKEQRKQQSKRSKQYKVQTQSKAKYSIHSRTEDFNLLNRIFLRENQRELKEKPYLALQYQQQSIIEREKLKKLIEIYPLHHHLTYKSNPTSYINTNQNHSSTIII